MFWSSIKRLLSMGIPMASTRLIQTFKVFIIMVVLAQMGHEVLAASLLISFLRAVVLLIFMSPLFALGSIIGRQVGQKNFNVIPAITQQSALLAILLAIPGVLIFVHIGTILKLFGQAPELIPIVSQYYHFAAFQLPFILLGTVCAQVIAGIKKQHTLIPLSVISTLTCTFFVFGFGLGHFGFPKLGVIGVGLGALISSVIYCLFMLYFLIKYTRGFGPICRFYLKGMEWFKLTLKIGLPIFVQITSQMLSLQFIAFMIGWLGLVAMASSQISSQYMLFAIVPIFGLAEASAITIGHAFGEKNFKQIKKLGLAGMLTAVSFTLFIAIIFFVFHRPFAALFIHFGQVHSTEIYHLMLWLLGIRVVSMLFDGVSDLTVGALRGLYDTKFPMFLGVFVNWGLMIPLAAFFGFGLHWGVIGIALGGTLSRAFNMLVILWRWRYQTKALNTWST